MQTVQYSNDLVNALIRENLRRCWPVSLVIFLIMFCTLILPALLSSLSDRYYNLENVITSVNPLLVIVEIALPIIAASAVFRYLQSSSGTTLVHSLPLNRRTLFRGNFLSGLILVFSPVIPVLITVLPFCLPGMRPASAGSSAVMSGPDVSDWLLWAGTTLLVLFFMYAMATLAACLTGNGAALGAIAMVLNFIVCLIFLMVSGYLDTFLIGYKGMSSSFEDVVVFLNPLFCMGSAFNNFESEKILYIIAFAIYFAVACAAIAAARLLYRRRRLERSGSPISFRFAEIAITDLVTLACMALMGIIFFTLYDDYGSGLDFRLAILLLIIGCVVGASLSFMVVTMLTQKTPRIFTLKTLKDFCVFAVIGVLFIAFTVFDLTGYTDRMPNQGLVKKAEMTLSKYPFQYPYKGAWSYMMPKGMTVEALSKDDISMLVSFHRGLVENEKAYRYRNSRLFAGAGSFAEGYEYGVAGNWSGNASIVYDLNGPFKQYRTYDLYSDYSYAGLREALAAMPAFRECMTLDRQIGYGSIPSITVIKTDEPSVDLIFSSSDVAALAKCLDNDFRRLAAAELEGTAPVAEKDRNSPYDPEWTLYLMIEYRYKSAYDSQGFYTDYIEYIATASYTETLEWLERHPPDETNDRNPFE